MSVASQPLVLMMAGGTGGHVYPALAVAVELRDRGYQVEWVGTHRGLEARVVPAAGFVLHYLNVRGIRGKNLLYTAMGVLLLFWSLLQALWLVLKLSPRCVVGMGGYVAGPAGVAAWLLRKPLLIHEQNAVAGTTNRLLSPLAATVIAGFPGAFSGDVDFRVLGNPVRRELLHAAADHPWNFHGQRALRLLVVGGSLGAKPLNELLPEAITTLEETARLSELEVWHQSGEAHADQVRTAYADHGSDRIRVTAFIEDMAAAYSWADLVVCRAGALTVAELAIMGRPAILVPLPHAIDDHQTANARALADREGGVLLPQIELSGAILAGKIAEFIDAPERLAAMAEASLAVALPDATASVADCCEELMRND
jgi:UDP-N-acetylglucosamine--N-acetylmuramyl-(pentapeptide) pyrophosphoryl-undecaprenol N-acetylglucosamine transferase